MKQSLGVRDEARFTALSEKDKDWYQFAAEFYLTILEVRPYQFEALMAGANALTALGYYEDGLALDKRLAELRPKDGMVLFNLACSLSLTRKIDEAFEVLRQAIRFGYDDLTHLRSDEDLANLHADPRFNDLLRQSGQPPLGYV